MWNKQGGDKRGKNIREGIRMRAWEEAGHQRVTAIHEDVQQSVNSSTRLSLRFYIFTIVPGRKQVKKKKKKDAVADYCKPQTHQGASGCCIHNMMDQNPSSIVEAAASS